MTALDPRALEAAHTAMDAAYSVDAMLTCPDCKSGVVVVDYGEGPGGDVCPRCGGAGIITPPDWNPLSTAITAYLASLPPAPAGSAGEDDATLTFANGEIYGLTMEQGRRAIAAALQADTIPSAIDGAIKGMRVLRTMLNSRGLGGADVAEAIIADLERMNADPAAAAAPPVQEPVAWRYRFDVEAAEGMDWNYRSDRPSFTPFGEEHVIREPLYASPSPLPAQEDGWQPERDK